MQFPIPPRTLLQDRYSIVRQIGQGSMRAVYEAKDERLGHRVALKQSIGVAQKSKAQETRFALCEVIWNGNV